MVRRVTPEKVQDLPRTHCPPILLGIKPDIGKPAGLAGPLARPIAWFAPEAFPAAIRRNYAHELKATLLFSLALAAIEGGVVAVYAKQTWADVVPSRRLNFLVALLGAAPEIANLVSFFWAQAAHGRPKVPLVNVLQAATVLLIAIVALIPDAPWGLPLLVAVVLAARVCWSGMLTVRPTIWRANYPRLMRARVVGRLSTAQVVAVALVGVLLGWILDVDRGWYPVVVTLACAAGLLAVGVWAKVRVRRQGALLRAETQGERLLPPWKGPLVVWHVLRRDKHYAGFMLWMFVLGMGNLMLTPTLAITLKDQFDFGYLHSILIISTIQSVVVPLAIPMWARLLDRAHVVRFRSIHAWSFVAAAGAYLAGVAMHRVEPLLLGAVLQGIGMGGGTLAWNLGHVDFARASETSQYMATHVTLNGVRGLLAPLLAVTLYEVFRASGLHAPTGVMIVVCVFTCAGALGFVRLRIVMGQLAARGIDRAA